MNLAAANGLLLAVPMAPLFVAPLILVFGRRLPRAGAWVTVAGSSISLVALLALVGQKAGGQVVWASSGDYIFTVGLQLDNLAHFTAILVACVALVIDVYSVDYMRHEEDQPRFFASFSFFTGSMLALVLSDSFLLLYAAWEGVGLASFLLIGFWYRQNQARYAALKAFVMTRLGDMGLLLGWLIALQMTGTTRIGAFLDLVHAGALAPAVLTTTALLFFFGAAGKSAQLPLTAWLPAAMVGPTPVSALIHSATMVAAGVYLLLRLFPLFSAAPFALEIVLWVGAATALLAALVATVQTDLKRILAWSTASQLGEMLLALGLAGPLAAAFHLAVHAVFKSSLFLSAGAIEHASGRRDLWRLGKLGRKIPLTALAFGAAGLALAGLPPFSGFWSEEAILGQAKARSLFFALLMVVLIFLAGVYISRAGAAIFLNWPSAPAPQTQPLGAMTKTSVAFLALLAVVLGTALSGRLEGLLPFQGGLRPSLPWSGLAVTSSLAGLAFGVWKAQLTGPLPAFGSFPVYLESGLEMATWGTVRIVLAIAQMINGVEVRIDGLARSFVKVTTSLAALADNIEGGFDTVGYELGQAGLLWADGIQVVETAGFSKFFDGFASLFSQAGRRLRSLQSGKVYLYTLGLFAWVLLIGTLSLLLWAFLQSY